jgi:RNase P subunit RPR2
MSTQASQRDESKYSIPKITCPECGTHLRLATVEPQEPGNNRMVFDCSCGFEYRMLERPRAHA